MLEPVDVKFPFVGVCNYFECNGSLSASLPTKVILTGVGGLVIWTGTSFMLSTTGAWLVGDVPPNPLTAISVIDAQLFCVFPLTVILTNLPTVFAGKL